MRTLLAVCLILALAVPGWADQTCGGVTVTGTCGTATDAADIQTKITAAGVGGYGTLNSDGTPRTDGKFDGDGVYVPAGSYTLAAPVTWSNKNILLIGAGQGTCTFSTSTASCSCGAGDTCITGNLASVTIGNANKAQFRISKFLVSSSSSTSNAVFLNSETLSTISFGWRVDHISQNAPNTGWEGSLLSTWGLTMGLIDHCNSIIFGEAAICADSFTDSDLGTIDSLNGSHLMAYPFYPGVATNKFIIEDNTFWVPTTSTTHTFFDTYYNGMRFIFRHNKVFNSTLYGHDTENYSLNSVWFEISNNVFDGGNVSSGYPFRMTGGGTGIVFNNTIVNYPINYFMFDEYRITGSSHWGSLLLKCDGTHNWDGNNGANPDASAPGWPCVTQMGRNSGGTVINSSGQQIPVSGSFPVYMWNNGADLACSTCTNQAGCGGCDNSTGLGITMGSAYAKGKELGVGSPHSTSGFGNDDFDYCTDASQPSGCGTHTLTYTASTYPHPLNTGSGGSSTSGGHVGAGYVGQGWQ